MYRNLQSLFDTEEGKSLRQKTYEQIYLDHGVDLEPILQMAHRVTLEDSTPENYRGRGYMASHMNWNLLGLLKEFYPNKMKVDKYGRDYYSVSPNVRIYFKKFNSKHAPDNIKTNHVEELNTMHLQLGVEPTTILYAGFRIESDKKWNQLEGCYLVEMKNLKKPNWVSDLSELSYTMAKNKPNVAPITRINLPEEIVVKAKSINSDLGKLSEGS